MSDVPNDFITQIFNTIDKVILHFVHNTYQHFISGNAAVITLAFTLYIALLGYRFLMDAAYTSDIGTITRHLVGMLIIYALIMNWEIYNKLIYNVFTNEPEKLSTVIIGSPQSLPSNGNSIVDALNTIWQKGMDIAHKFYQATNFSNFIFAIYGTIVFVTTLLLCLFGAALFIYAKLAMAVMLALGFLFILFSLFAPTRGLTQSWIQQLINFALIPVVTSAIISLMFTNINETLGDLSIKDFSDDKTIGEAFTNLVAYDLVSFIAVFLLMQVLPICSALSGGVTLLGIQHAGEKMTVTLMQAGKGLGLARARFRRKVSS